MFYSNISDDEVKRFHDKVHVNINFPKVQLFKYESNKCYPLFYADKITGNSNLRIIDNKLILYTDDSDLDSIEFISETNEDDGFNIIYKTVTIADKVFLKLHFYNPLTHKALMYFEFKIVELNKTYSTDKYGNQLIELNDDGEYTITDNNGYTKTIEVE